MGETIEYCLRNVDDETRDRLAGDACAPASAGATGATGIDVVERRCLQRCGTCYSGDFLVVDGTLATGESHAALLAEHLPEEVDR